MLERFHVPEDIAVRVPQETMRATTEAIFQEMGMPSADARQAADVLIYADLRGIESHGVSNMMRLYVQWFRKGDINPTPEPKILHEAAAVATMDSDRGHGLVIAPQAMNMAIERAEQYGIGAITVTNGQTLRRRGVSRRTGAGARHGRPRHDLRRPVAGTGARRQADGWPQPLGSGGTRRPGSAGLSSTPR